ncbi:MAG: hypothetical protein EKK54_02540 [Neisseriaceae bacterium]|nr:MAG: hypothetical protein EKK54_02540 [Neisseriaceae bacterium]
MLLSNNTIKFNALCGLLRGVCRKLKILRYYRLRPEFESLRFKEVNRNNLFVFSIAFNNYFVIEYQVKLIKANLLGEYTLLIIDSSNVNEVTSKIRQLCDLNKISYIKVKHFASDQPSDSHGVLLNWVYRNIIERYHIYKFGFLDHDIFPIEKVNLNERVSNSLVGLHGLKQYRGDRWYLWAGFCFFDLTKLSVKNLDFLPIKGLDTGGGNWQNLYNHINHDLINCSYDKRNYESSGESSIHQINNFEVIDDCWIHTVNASGWYIMDEVLEVEKHDKIKRLLDFYFNLYNRNI